MSARAVTISETKSPAPCSRQSVLKAEFVIPAMGARTTGVSSTTSLFAKPPFAIGNRSGAKFFVSNPTTSEPTKIELDQSRFALAPWCRVHEL